MSLPPPIAPNWNPANNAGLLSTNRYDFEAHIIGTNFRHTAKQIDLLPDLTIGGILTTNVQDAITNLISAINPSPILATATTPGLVQLSSNGDVQGTATRLKITGLQNFPLNNTPPTTNNVLTWNGTSWGPAPTQGNFTAAGDLAGNSSTQQVIGLTGSGSSPNRTIRASNDIISFISTAIPNISQVGATNTNGTNMTIKAQGVSSGTGKGGNLNLLGGVGSAALSGGVSLSINGDPAVDAGQYLFQVAQVVNNQNIAAFFPSNPTGITFTDMPTNTGSGVIYVGNATTPPIAASTTGSILWSQSGQLNVMQSNGVSFAIGSVPNPSINVGVAPGVIPNVALPSAGQVVYSTTVSSLTGIGATALTFTVPPNCSMYINIIYTGKLANSVFASQYNYSMNVVKNASNPPTLTPISTTLGGLPFSNGPAWNSPNFPIISSNNVVVSTGWYNTLPAVWTVITQITIVSA